jgi:hypothetical protein
MSKGLQLLNFVLCEDQRRHRTADSHGKTPSGDTPYSISYLRDCTLGVQRDRQ